METVLSGRVLLLGDDINTGTILPGGYMHLTEAQELAAHAFEGISDDLPKRLPTYSLIWAGSNFGCGSSREQAPLAIKGAGIKAIIATSFGRIFYRNAINHGLPLIECAAPTGQLNDADSIAVDLVHGVITTPGGSLTFSPPPAFLLETLETGGLIPHLRRHLQQRQSKTIRPVPVPEEGKGRRRRPGKDTMRGATFAEKLLAKKAGLPQVTPGDILHVSPDVAMAPSGCSTIIRRLEELSVTGQQCIWDPDRVVVILDHRAPATSVETANGHRRVRDFVAAQGIHHFYDLNEGICHNVMVERGHVLPGTLIVGADSHTTSYGCLAAFATGIGFTEMAAVWVTGRLWLKVPESMKITLNGHLQPGVSAKDIMLRLAAQLSENGCTYRAVEFCGEALAGMKIAERLTLTNLAVDLGAKAAFCPCDRITRDYLAGIGVNDGYEPLSPDPHARYAETIDLQVDSLEPQVAPPPKISLARPVGEVAGLKIDQAFLGSCTNGSLEDLAVAARILKGKHLAPGVRMIVTPATRGVYLEALRRGHVETLCQAGALVMNPGCGACSGGHHGTLGDGERCIASINRNYPGRMGNRQAEIYLASPATVAASALAGVITDPRPGF